MQQLENYLENHLENHPEQSSKAAQSLQKESGNSDGEAVLESSFSVDSSANNSDAWVNNTWDNHVWLNEIRASETMLGEINVSELANSGSGAMDGLFDWLKGLLSGQENESQQAEADAVAAGKVQKLVGSAAVIRDGEQMALLLGDDVFADDVISTGVKSSIGIVFIDGMEFNLGNDAKLLIDEFVFDQAQSSGEQSLSAIKGAFSYQSGLLAQSDPSAVTIKTALGTLGIRGTKLIGLSDYPEGTCVITLLDGEIEVTRDKGGDSIILDQRFETARMKLEWEYIDKSQLSREEVLDTFLRLFGGDEDELQDFVGDNGGGDKSSSLDAHTPYSLYEFASEYSTSMPSIAAGADG